MAQAPRDLGLVDEQPLPALRRQQPGTHELEGHGFVDQGVLRLVDHTHAALSEALLNEVSVGDSLAGRIL